MPLAERDLSHGNVRSLGILAIICHVDVMDTHRNALLELSEGIRVFRPLELAVAKLRRHLHNGTFPVSPVPMAYWMRTSGTVSQAPTVVRVSHARIVPNIADVTRRLDMSPQDVMFLASPLTFDPSVVELFSTLSCGARIVIVPHHIKADGAQLAQRLFEKHRVTILMCTPSLFLRFVRHLMR